MSTKVEKSINQYTTTGSFIIPYARYKYFRDPKSFPIYLPSAADQSISLGVYHLGHYTTAPNCFYNFSLSPS